MFMSKNICNMVDLFDKAVAEGGGGEIITVEIIIIIIITIMFIQGIHQALKKVSLGSLLLKSVS